MFERKEKPVRLLTKGSLDISKIENNEFNDIRFLKIKNSKNKDYVIELSVESNNTAEGVSVYLTDKDKHARPYA